MATWKRSTLHLDDDWLGERRRLFLENTVPSMLGQTNLNFKWVVCFDSRTPISYIDSLNPEVAYFEPLMLGSDWHEGLEGYLSGLKSVITTRLDSDDAVSPSYIDDVQRAVFGNRTEIVSFNLGWLRCNGLYYKTFWLANPFLSLWERGDRPRSVYAWEHGQLSRMPGFRSYSRRNWLVDIHGGNVSNDKMLLAGSERAAPPQWMCR